MNHTAGVRAIDITPRTVACCAIGGEGEAFVRWLVERGQFRISMEQSASQLRFHVMSGHMSADRWIEVERFVPWPPQNKRPNAVEAGIRYANAMSALVRENSEPLLMEALRLYVERGCQPVYDANGSPVDGG